MIIACLPVYGVIAAFVLAIVFTIIICDSIPVREDDE